MRTTIGVISDTHGLLRPEVVETLRGCDVILHAGDIGGPDVLDALKSIAPTYAVRGNTDGGVWTQSLPDNDVVEISGHWFYLIHRIEDLDLDPPAADISAVIFGHTHRPGRFEKDGVLYFNPGDAGYLRYLPYPTVGRISIKNSGLESKIISLGA